MAISRSEIFKLVVLALLLVMLQLALFSDISLLPFNLPLAAIFVASALLPLSSSVILASALAVMVSLMNYGETLFWTYPSLAFIASKINPKPVANKLVVCLIFNIMFTPVFEFIYAGHLDNVLLSTLTNITVSISLYLVLRLSFERI